MKFYKRDPDRALSGMAELTFEQRGAYNSLLDLLYSRDGKVPDDDVRVARMMSAHWRQWRKVKLQLIEAGKVWVEDGYLYANRVQETLKEAADFSQEQRKKAAKRWVKPEKVNKNNGSVMPPGNALTPTATPTPIEGYTPSTVSTTEPLLDTSLPTQTVDQTEFDQFWNEVPRKIGKGQARRAYKAARRKASGLALLASMKAFAEQCNGTDPKFICHPATWLNGERWLDDPPESQANRERDEAEIDALCQQMTEEFLEESERKRKEREERRNVRG